MQPNLNFSRLGENYLFSEVRARTRAFCEAHPGVRVTDLGVGDVTLPLAAPVVRALRAASAEMGRRETFRGYGPAEGYALLREALAARYARLGARISPEDIFVSDGAKSDLSAILALFSPQNTVLVTSPVYPVYVDTNLVCGRRVQTLAATRENGFLPLPGPDTQADIVYLCSPGNPTGAAYSMDGLAAWVRWALGHGALLVFDAAYEAFIQDKALPRSIYQVEGARECAIEIGSFSKSAGFTGLRCGWAVVPQALRAGGVPNVDTFDLILGNYAGPIGATSVLILVACAMYLWMRRDITLGIPFGFLLSCALVAFFYPRVNTLGLELPWQYLDIRLLSLKYEMLSGALIFAAVFLVNEPVTRPKNTRAHFVYGMILGFMTMMFRYFGSYDTGVCFAVLAVNALAGYLDRLFSQKIFRREVRS